MWFKFWVFLILWCLSFFIENVEIVIGVFCMFLVCCFVLIVIIFSWVLFFVLGVVFVCCVIVVEFRKDNLMDVVIRFFLKKLVDL